MSEQDIAEKLIPSVVCIQNYQITQQYGFMQTDSEGSEVSPAGEAPASSSAKTVTSSRTPMS